MRYFYNFYNGKVYTENELNMAFNEFDFIEYVDSETNFDAWKASVLTGESNSMFEVSERIYSGRNTKDEINDYIRRNTDLDVYVDVDLETSNENYCLRCEDTTCCEIELHDVLKMIHDYLNVVSIDTDDKTSMDVWNALIEIFRVKRNLFDF